MLPSKSKSGLSETPNNKSSQSTLNRSGLSETSNNKATPATPRVSKLGRTPSKSESESHSPLQNSRLSVDRSPRSVESKPTTERRSPKISTPDKQPRALKGSELQVQLASVQEDLKKAKELLASVEKEKTQALEELREAKRSADKANEKLEEALVAQKRAQENSEIEKFRADELEQAGIEAAQKREEEWQKEIESVRNQHTVDVSALLSITQELQRIKHELGMVTDAKNTALSHADDAMKIAEINAEKVGILSAEVTRLKVLLDSKQEIKTNEAAELVQKLTSDVESLKRELDKAQEAEKKLLEMESLIEGLRIEVTDAKTAESDAGSLVNMWKKKAELLEVQVEEAHQSEKSALESLSAAMKKLEEWNASLQDAESEITSLRGKEKSLEIEITRHKGDLEDSDRCLAMAKQEALEMETAVEVLKSELQNLEEEKRLALDNEKQSASIMQSLLEEKKTLLNELEISRDEGEKSKKAMEGLASALHEVSTEARESQERILAKQAEIAEANAQIEELRQALKTSEAAYEVLLNEAKDEINCLKSAIERSDLEEKRLRSEWDAKELNFSSSARRSEEEIAVVIGEMDKVVSKLIGAESEAKAAKEEGVQLLNKLKQAESVAFSANEASEYAKAENSILKERLLDKENELQSIIQENDDLQTREEAALQKVKELSTLLAEATAKKTEENGELSNSEKEYDFLPKATEIPVDDADDSGAGKLKPELSLKQPEVHGGEHPKLREENGNVEGREPVEAQAKVWENLSKDLSPEKEPEPESLDDELESKIDGDSFDQSNGLSTENVDNGGRSPIKEQQLKKKKPLLRKFGSLLKKKSNQK